MSRRIVLATFGSFGDLHPYLALALELKARGHTPVLATSGFYRDKVESEGIAFPGEPDLRRPVLAHSQPGPLLAGIGRAIAGLAAEYHPYRLSVLRPPGKERRLACRAGRLPGRRAAEELHRLLSDPRYAAHAEEIGCRVQVEQGAKVACDALLSIEKHEYIASRQGRVI